MLRLATRLLLLPLATFFMTHTTLPAQAADPGPWHPRELIIRLKPEVAIRYQRGQLQTGQQALDALNLRYGLRSIRPLRAVSPAGAARTSGPAPDRLLLLRFEREQSIPDLLRTYRATGLFEYVEPNYRGYGAGRSASVEPNDQQYFRQWYHINRGTFDSKSKAGADIDSELAWGITTGSEAVVVAILDSGMKLDHPEIQGRVWTNTDEQSNGADTDGNGYIDDINGGWDFVNNDNLPSDDHGHGSNVLGLLGATGNNTIGFAGMDWNCRLLVGKILDEENSGFYADWTEAIFYAVDNGADIINMSVGGSSFSNAMLDAVNYAHSRGVLITVSMMNVNNNQPFYPAAYPTTVAVGATDTNDERASPFFWSATSGSNYGDHIDLCAPGNFMYGLRYDADLNFSSYWGGTSQAAPLVAGAAALIKAIRPEFTADTIRAILNLTAEDRVGNPSEDSPGWDPYHGHGRLNVLYALLYARGSTARIDLCAGESFQGISQSGLFLDTLATAGGSDSLRLLLVRASPEILLQEPGISWDPDSNQGSIAPELTGGFPPLTYRWNSGDTTLNLAGRPEGSYTLTVTDALGCSQDFSFELSGVTGTVELPEGLLEVSLSPNPSSGSGPVFLELRSSFPQQLQIGLLTATGQRMQTERFYVGGTQRIPLDLSTLSAGWFLVEVQNRKGERLLLKGLKN